MATHGGSSLPEAAFRVGAKTAGCIPGDRLDRAWGTPGAILPGVTCCAHRPCPSSWPGLGSSHAPSGMVPGVRSLFLCHHARPEKGHAWGSSLPEAAFRVGLKTAGCIPGDRLDRAWGTPGAILPWVTSPHAGPAPLPNPGLGLATPLAARTKVIGSL